MIKPARLTLEGRIIGLDCPAFIIAEMSANHGQNLEHALEIIRVFAAAGADAIKLQTYTPDTMTIACDGGPFQIHGGLWDGRNLHELYQEAYTPWEWHAQLKEEANRLGLVCFSTPFEETSLAFLEQLDMPMHKVASFELTDLPFLRKVAATGKPVIMSTGMATLAEIDEGVRTLREHGCGELALLKCTSAYPAPLEDMNLRTIPHLAATFGVVAGLSDHTMGHTAAVAAVALGASIIEKHVILRRADGGPDSAFSMEPQEFQAMVTAIREAEKALGGVSYTPSALEQKSRAFRRSIFAVADIPEGTILDEGNIRVIRPAQGLAPGHWEAVLGCRAARAIARGTPLEWSMVKDRMS